MPFVEISMARGQLDTHLETVSRAVQEVLVAGLCRIPEGDLPLLRQRDPGATGSGSQSRAGPGSPDRTVYRIVDGLERGETDKRRLRGALARLLWKDPGVDLIMVTSVVPEGTPFAEGAFGADPCAPAARDVSAGASDGSGGHTRAALARALGELFAHRDSRRILSILRGDLTGEKPAVVPPGGSAVVGPEVFEKYFAGTPDRGEVWDSFELRVEHVREADDHLVVGVTVKAVPSSTGQALVTHDLWLFRTAGDRTGPTRT